jgi:hypothetical protein
MPVPASKDISVFSGLLWSLLPLDPYAVCLFRESVIIHSLCMLQPFKFVLKYSTI